MAKRPKKQKRSSQGVSATGNHAQGTPPVIKNKLFLLQALVIAVAGLWVFWPASHGDWLWDDDILVRNNLLVHDSAGLWKIWLEPDRLMDFFPLKVSVEWLEWQLWQNDTFDYHLTNIILHIINSLLIWRLLSKFGLRLAWLGGLIFAIHPVTVESVAWISELKNTLSLPPLLLAMCAWIDYDERKNRKDYFLALGLFLVAMLCKTTVVMLPVVILLYAWWKRGRVGWSDLKVSAPFFAVSLALGLTTIWFLHHHAIAQNGIAMGGFLSHLALAGLSIAFYFSKCILPLGLEPIYPKWVIDPPSLIQFLPWPILGGVVWWLWTKRMDWGRHVLLGLGFFLINLAPFIGFTDGSYMDFTWVMDHLLYLPLIGLIGLMVAGMGQLSEKLPLAFRPFSIGIVAAITMLLAWGSHAYAGMFADEETFWAYTLKRNPNAWVAYSNLGNSFFKKGQMDEALIQFQKALELHPNFPEALSNCGAALFKKGQVDEAIAHYHKALEIRPSYAEVYNNLGLALLQKNQMDEALIQFQKALEFDPNYAEAYDNLGFTLFHKGQVDEAIVEFQKALAIDPVHTKAHNNLGYAFLKKGETDQAIIQFQKALEINPNLVEARKGLGVLLAQKGDLDGALVQIEEVLRIKPDDTESQNNLVTLRGMLRQKASSK